MFKKITHTDVITMRTNRARGISNTEVFSRIKHQHDIPADHKLAIEIDQIDSPDYRVIKNKHTRLGYCLDGSTAPVSYTAAPAPTTTLNMQDFRARITTDELEQLQQARANGSSNKPIFAAIKARLDIDPSVKLKVEIDETGDPDYRVLKTKDGEYVYAMHTTMASYAMSYDAAQYVLPGITPAHMADQAGGGQDDDVQGDGKGDGQDDGQDDPSHRIRTLIGGLLGGLVSSQDDEPTAGANTTINIDQLVIYELNVNQ